MTLPANQPDGRRRCSMLSGLTTITLALLTLLPCSCHYLPGSRQAATPTPAILADTFFSGCAYLDANSNSQIDSEDQKLQGARVVVTLSKGIQLGATTLAHGCGTVVVPGGLPEESWPVTVGAEAPEGSAYRLVSPAQVVLQFPKGHADFLFAAAP